MNDTKCMVTCGSIVLVKKDMIIGIGYTYVITGEIWFDIPLLYKVQSWHLLYKCIKVFEVVVVVGSSGAPSHSKVQYRLYIGVCYVITWSQHLPRPQKHCPV